MDHHHQFFLKIRWWLLRVINTTTGYFYTTISIPVNSWWFVIMGGLLMWIYHCECFQSGTPRIVVQSNCEGRPWLWVHHVVVSLGPWVTGSQPQDPMACKCNTVCLLETVEDHWHLAWILETWKPRSFARPVLDPLHGTCCAGPIRFHRPSNTSSMLLHHLTVSLTGLFIESAYWIISHPEPVMSMTKSSHQHWHLVPTLILVRCTKRLTKNSTFWKNRSQASNEIMPTIGFRRNNGGDPWPWIQCSTAGAAAAGAAMEPFQSLNNVRQRQTGTSGEGLIKRSALRNGSRLRKARVKGCWWWMMVNKG